MKTTEYFTVSIAVLLLAGCASQPPALSEPTATSDGMGEVREAPSESVTIETVWEKIGCKEDDIANSFGTISEADSPVNRTGTCFAFGQNDTSFFYELEDETAARAWYRSGALEVGADDTLFIEGGVIVLSTTHAATAEFANLFDRFD
jgi:hypothetical protein